MKFMKLISVFAFVLASGFAFAAAPGKIAVNSVSGTVTVVANNGAAKQLVLGDVLQENTVIATDKESSAKIVLGNGTVISLAPNTTIDLSQFEQNNPAAVEGQNFASFAREPEETSGSLTTVRLVKGTATFKVAKLLVSSSLTVKTRAGNVVVKGTTFSVTDDGSHVTTSVVEGAVSVVPTGRGSVTVTGGKSISIPVSSSGAVGTPSYRGISPAQKEQILNSVSGEEIKTASSSTSSFADTDDGAFVDPEIPAWAQDADSISGPDAGKLNSASSVGE